MDYKKTLNLPKTDFPMKANLVQKEPEILKEWEKQDIYKVIRDSSRGKPLYILHDGLPMPTAIFIWERHSIRS